jgi:hypothetical protein
MASCGGASVLMQKTPFSIILCAEGELLLMQKSIIGGSMVMEVTAEAVIPPNPALPSVVTTWTVAATRLIASLKRA